MCRSQRLTPGLCNSIVTQPGPLSTACQVLRDRMIRAEHSPVALQGVLTQGAGELRLAQLIQGVGQGGGRRQGGGVVEAEESAAAFQRVLAEGAGRLGLAQTD